MMSNKNNLKIHSLHIKNFKSINEAVFTFDEKNLIIFDGPNGYGKTTAFEAIEIILSKTPRRYRSIALDKRSSFVNSPIHKNDKFAIELSLHLSNNEESISIKRYFDKAVQKKSVDNHIKNIFETSKLLINDKESTEEELERILDFRSINTLFNVLNYVEQDENTFFLKKDPKDRYKELSSLLGAESEISQLEKIKIFEKKLSDLLRQRLEDKENITKNNEEVLSFRVSDISYKKLIKNKDFVWDQKDIANTSIDIRNSCLLELEKIKYLYSHKESVNDIHFLHNIEKYMNDDFINKFIDSYWRIENYENLKTENNNRIQNEALLNNNRKLIESIDKFDYDYFNKDNILNNLKEKGLIIDAFKIQLSLLLTQRDALGVQGRILNNIKNKRIELLSIQEEHKNLINLADSECPTCGFDWNSSDDLLSHIEQTELKIFREYNISNENFEKLKKEINTFLASTKEMLVGDNGLIAERIRNLISSDDFAQLCDYYAQMKQKIESYLSLINEEDRVLIITMVNSKIVNEKDNVKSKIKSIVENRKPNLDPDLNIHQIISDFDTYFQNNIGWLNDISFEDISNKSLYITAQYYLAINKNLNTLKHKIEKLESFKSKLESIKDIFDKGIKEYTKNIVNTVTIPFYIFTGKILQHHSLGSGLVLDLDVVKKDPQLKINPTGRDQEASYTLSSGQLSATVISLMLVLNKVYNKSKLGTILIDDPLQTLDEINTHSLIEVLKYNFSDQQVVLSTHEDRYSKLIRYKYDKFNLPNKNIKMKDII